MTIDRRLLLCGTLIVVLVSTFTVPSQAQKFLSESRRSAPLTVGPRYALLVGVEEYDSIPSLGGPNKDVCALRQVLVSVAGFKPENVIVLSRPGSCPKVPTLAPTRGEFFKALNRLTSKMPPGAVFLLAFSGHGVSRGTESYLLMQDSAEVSGNPVRAVKVSKLVKELVNGRTPPEHLLLFLDACRDSAGQSAGAALNKGLKESFNLTAGAGRTRSASVLFSADLGERSYIRSTGPVSFFTWAIIKGLIGEAADSGGRITTGALAQYVEKEVPELIRYDFLSDKKEQQQHPKSVYYGDNPEDFTIAEVPIPPTRFFYTVEVFIVPLSFDSKIVATPLHQDLVSPRPMGFLDETLPLNVSEVNPPLTVIRIPYKKEIRGKVAKWDYLVRMTFHYGRWHRAFILCPSSPQVPERKENPEIKTDFSAQTLVIDALRSFAMWGHCLRDVEACLREDDEGSTRIEYKTFTNCLPR